MRGLDKAGRTLYWTDSTLATTGTCSAVDEAGETMFPISIFGSGPRGQSGAAEGEASSSRGNEAEEEAEAVVDAEGGSETSGETYDELGDAATVMVRFLACF